MENSNLLTVLFLAIDMQYSAVTREHTYYEKRTNYSHLRIFISLLSVQEVIEQNQHIPNIAVTPLSITVVCSISVISVRICLPLHIPIPDALSFLRR